MHTALLIPGVRRAIGLVGLVGQASHRLRNALGRPLGLLGLTLLLAGGGVVPAIAQQRISAGELLRHVQVLAADSMEGRATGTRGGARAAAYVQQAFADRGVRPFAEGYAHPFQVTLRSERDEARGVNLIGYLPAAASDPRGPVLLLTAHYDHLGIRGGEIYNGADDNASGVAALLEIAAYLQQHPLRHRVVVAAFDAEEQGLRGAQAFLDHPPLPLDSIALVINLDMVSRSDENTLFAAGTRHYPFLAPYVDRAAEAAPIRLRRGHDAPRPRPSDDWTYASDHGPFHRVGIPFLYFGVEDHPGYHRPSDDADAIHPVFFGHAVETVLDVLLAVAADLPAIRAASESAAGGR